MTPVAAGTGESTPHVTGRDYPLACCDAEFRRRWQAFLREASWPHYQQSYESALLRSRSGWTAAFVCVEAEERIVAGAQVLSRAIAGMTPVATAPSGPMWLPGAESALPVLFEAMQRYCRRRRVVFCRLNPHCPAEHFPLIAPLLPANCAVTGHLWSYWNLPRANMHLDIGGSLEAITGNMHRRARQSYKASLASGVRIRIGERADIAALARLLSKMGERKELLVRDERFFQAVLETHAPEDTVLLLAEVEGSVIGAALMVACGPVAYHLYGAFDYEKRLLHPNVALQVEMIRWAKSRGCTRYDLGGTCTNWPPAEDHKGYGVYRFKSRLGAVPVLDAPYCDLIYRPAWYRVGCFAEDAILPLLLEHGRGRFIVAGERIRGRRPTA